MDAKYQINPMIPLAVNLADGRRRFILFCGSGISKDAGIPTGKDILFDTLCKIYQQEKKKEKYSKEEVLEWYQKNKHLKDMAYSEILDIVYPGMEQKRLYLNSFFAGKEPGEVHKLMVKMVKLGLLRFIITTNFDNLIEKALDLEGFRDKYSVISTNDQAKNSDTWDKVEFCRIYKIHGDKDQGIIRNSPKELEKLDEYIEKDFQELIDRHGIIVLGYAGEDKGVMSCLEKREYHRYPIYWHYRQDVNSQVKNILLNQDGVLIKHGSASGFLNELLDRIKIIQRTSETDTLDAIKNRYEQILIRNNPFEIKARIEEERKIFISDISSVYDALGQSPTWENLWHAHTELVEKAARNIIFSEQLLRFEMNKGWEEFLPIFEEMHSVNQDRDRYGRNGLINYLFYSLFLVIGSRALRYERFSEIRKLFSLKRLTRDRVEDILDWNIIASYIEQKAQADPTRWHVPRFQYLFGLIETDKFPIQRDELITLVMDFDFLCFVYSVRYPMPKSFPHWFPCSAYYFEHRTPQFLQKIKLDDGYCERMAKGMFNINKDNLIPFLKDKVAKEYANLIRSIPGFVTENPFEELLRD